MAWLNWPAWQGLEARGRGIDAPEVKDSRAGPLIALTSAGRARWTPRDYANLASEGFTKNPAGWKVVQFRRATLRVFDGAVVLRVWEVEGTETVYATADMAVDFPGGVHGDARIGVSQAGGRTGWGSEALVALSA